MEQQTFKSSYFLRLLSSDYNPFTPNVLMIDGDHIEYRRRNWHLISVDTENLHFQNVTGITIDKHLFGATIIIKSKGSDSMYIHGFWKKKANQIKAICYQHISANTHRGRAKAVAEVISEKAGKVQNISLADELNKLKDLMDNGVISQEEFEAQKRKLMEG